MNHPILSPLTQEGAPTRPSSTGGRRGVRSSRFEDPRPMLLDMLRVVWSNKARVLAVALLFGAAGLFYALTAAPVYEASSLLLVDRTEDRMVSFEPAGSASVSNREYLLTQVEFIKSRNVLERVIDSAQLASHPLYDPTLPPTGLLAKGTEIVRGWFGLSSGPPMQPEEVRAEILLDLERDLHVEPVRLSQMVRISFESRDPVMAARISNAIADAYIKADMDARYSMIVSANLWLNEQAEKLRANLAASERVLQAYREEKGLIDKQSEAQGGAGRQLEALTQRLVEARVRTAQAAQNLAQVRSARGPAIESIPAVIADPNVIRAREIRAQAQRRLAELSENYGPAHPLYQTAEAELAAAEVAVQHAAGAVIDGLRREYQSAKAVEEGLERTIEQVQKSIQAQNRDEFELANYEREVATNRMLLENFLARVKETTVASDIHTTSARVIDRAVPPIRPIKPKKTQILLLMLTLGGLAGVAMVLIKRRLDQGIDSIETAEAVLDQQVIAALPTLPAKKHANAHRMIELEPGHQFSEGIRTLRSSILLSNLDMGSGVVMVTSSVPGEGKSTISFNLALAMSQTKRTVFVECDMRRPSLRERGIATDRPGLHEVLSQQASLEDCLTTSSDGKLSILTAGKSSRNPLELLSSDQFPELIGQLSVDYDMVILDTPPIAVVSDTLFMARIASVAMLVVHADRTPRKTVRRSVENLHDHGVDLLGVVLNHLDFRKAETYYGEYTDEYSAEYFQAYSGAGSRSQRRHSANANSLPPGKRFGEA